MGRLLLIASSLLFIAGCRQDMHNQPKFIPLRSTEFYSDRRSARYPMPGTVPRLDNEVLDREQIDPGSYYLTGRHGFNFGNELPFPLTRDVLLRGQERYNIYCTPCHSRMGDGGGMIVQRGFKQPPSFHEQRLRNAPLGHFYDVISNGFGGMPDYGAQVKPADRWAIASYLRVLQLSQNATEADVPAEDRAKLNEAGGDRIRIPETSYIPKTMVSPKPVASPSPTRGGVRP